MNVCQNAVGVGFLLFCWSQGFLKMFTVRELKSKPEISKKKGMISFPIETFDPKLDSNEEDTIIRLIKEEIGYPIEQIRNFGIIPKRFCLIPHREDIETVYGYGLLTGDINHERTPLAEDIVFSGWWTIGALLNFSKTRVETRPILEDFIINSGAVDIYTACAP